MRTTPPEKLEAVMKTLAAVGALGSLEDIRGKMGPGRPDTRALQRWLAKLIAQGKVTKQGSTCAARYAVAAGEGQLAEGSRPPMSKNTATAGTPPRTGVLLPPDPPAASLGRPPVLPGVDVKDVDNIIGEIVRRRMNRVSGAMYLTQAAKGQPNPALFVFAVQTQLGALEDHNCTAYGIGLEEFRAFVKTW